LRHMMGAAKAEDVPAEAYPHTVIRYAMHVCRVAAQRVDADFLYDGPAELPKVAMDETELATTLINLLTNASHALGDANRLNRRVRVTAADAGAVVRISISDDGVGMSDEVLAKIGTPFFSTREKGTGLGVMQCRRFVEKIGGKIEFKSKLSEGTTVTLEL